MPNPAARMVLLARQGRTASGASRALRNKRVVAQKTSVRGASAGSTTVSKPVDLSVEFYSRHWGQSGVLGWSLGIESESSSTVTDEEAALMLLTEFHASGDFTGNGTVHAGSPDKSVPFQELLFGIEVEE
eukprot:CAMPEP_0194521292 /NCGR_PEP_ID=MMETSP0253-20130528/55557_1 /TAXON_ID=2966 /ORGANISM="Noctiluca scintillans" /LENGTH=129 /DNA_ID=CAMNT_0039365637 /DNA_START=1 /DNA_END=390 /DNA_ORIENTATION=+